MYDKDLWDPKTGDLAKLAEQHKKVGKKAAHYKLCNGNVKEAKVKEKVTTHTRYGERNIKVGCYTATLWSDSPNTDKYPQYTCEISFGHFAFLGRDSACAKKAVSHAVNALQKHHGSKEQELEIVG